MKNQKKSKVEVPDLILEKPFNFKKYYYLLGILVFFIFMNSISNGYNLDDELVTKNHKLTSRGLESVVDIFKSPYYSDDMGYAYGYRPIVHLSFAIEHQLFGEKPQVSHFFNVFLYVLSVLFFFKLLLKWTGEKGLNLALIATVLFAIHPIHTEVVASIKNRDEILAFLFMILAGLSLERFLDQKRWISLLWILFFFTIAMLSKKSVFPMAILFPMVAIFVKKIELNQLIKVSIILFIPATLIASEMDLPRMILMNALCVAFVSIAFYIRLMMTRETDWKKILLDYRLISIISLCVFTLSIFENNLLYLYIALPVLMLSYVTNKRVVTIIFLFELLIAAWFFRSFEMMHLGLFLSLYLGFEKAFEKSKDWIYWLLALLFLVTMFSVQLVINDVYGILTYIFCLYFFHKQWILGLLLSFIVFVLSFIIGEIPPLFSVLLLFLFVLKAGKIYVKDFGLWPVIFIGGTMILFVFHFNSNLFEFQQQNQLIPGNEKSIEVQRNFPEDKSVLKEGRNLELIENTLVLPHSNSELAGTGMATLGEYTRLMVFPYELSFYYGYAKTRTISLNNPWVWVSILVHLSFICIALWQIKKRPLLSLGIVWYLFCIVLFSNWIELVAGMVGERLAFTASAGFCIFIASLILWIKPGFSLKQPKVIELVVLAVVVLFTVRTIVRNPNWKDPLTLMGNDIEHLHNSSQANNLYALKLMESSFTASDETFEANQAKQRLAIEHFDKALQIWPKFFNAAYDKGRAGMYLGDTLTAIDGFEKAVAIGSATFLDPYYQLGDLYLKMKRNKEFLSLSKKIYEISKDNPDGYSALARGYFTNGYADSAKIVLENAVMKFPENVELKKNLEMVINTVK